MSGMSGFKRAVVGGVVALALAAAGCSSPHHAPADAVFTGLQGSAQVDIPPSVTPPAHVQFTTPAQPIADTAYNLDPYAVPLAPPVDIQPSGSLPPGQVKVTLTLPKGLPAAAVKVAYIAVYNATLGEFVRLPTTVDTQHQTLTTLAPHFSIYQAFADTVKKGIHKVIKVTDAVVLSWVPPLAPLAGAIEGIQDDAVDSLFALGPDLQCSSEPPLVQVHTKDLSHGQLFEACTNPVGANGSTVVKFSNHYAFPVLLWPHSDVGVGFADLPDNVDLFGLVRYVFWMQLNKLEVEGPNNAQLTLSAKAKLPQTFNGYLDWGAVGVDLGNDLLAAVMPETKGGEGAVQVLARALESRAGTETGAAAAAELPKAVGDVEAKADTSDTAKTIYGYVSQINDVAGCITSAVTGIHGLVQPDAKVDASSVFNKIFGIALDCVKAGVDSFGPEMIGVVDSLADSLHALPELMEAKAAQMWQDLPSHSSTDPWVTVSLSEPAITQPTAPPNGLADGTYYGDFDRSDVADPVNVGSHSISMQRQEYFTGTAAQAACRQDKVPQQDWGPDGECTDNYRRDPHTAPFTLDLPLSPRVHITTTLFTDNGPVPNSPLTLSQLDQKVKGLSGHEGLYQITIVGGQVTALSFIYHP